MIPADESLELLLQWPLILIVLDGYEPQLAGIVVETIREQSEETLQMMMKWAGEAAREGIDVN